ncbi:aldose 1-epimerase family protein [Desemzia sp. RIT804]|uniref:aldose 1-epimerase family protein n=1 Tax=Desemzia sp. RIT 804 TaxID=2810209 RepID=UPI0019514812|nr:aldose 1-epimerase family protein [Desemzia sp. RIT 804]MBM6613766.1 aldose 1-epimerase family protein [Desemzia sp. RIT 804]
MTVSIKNEHLTVEVAPKGAELQSIRSNETGIEYLWQGDKEYWNRKSPVLFPIVGRLKDDSYIYKGHSYSMTQHGFARDSIFEITEHEKHKVAFQLHSTEESKEMYPFNFLLTITYEIIENTVQVQYSVKNTDNKETMYFSIGGHPGFNVPLTTDTKFEDYYLNFLPRRSRRQIPLSGPFADILHTTLAQTNTTLRLDRELFNKDALVFEVKNSNTFGILSDKTPHSVEVTFEDYPYVGVWSVPGKDAPFVCIEPWHGIADTVDASGKLEEKLGIQTLTAQETFQTKYSIQVN